VEIDKSTKDKADKAYHDLYLATGKPGSVITRLFMLERADLDMVEKIEQLTTVINRATWLLIATLAGVIVDIALKH